MCIRCPSLNVDYETGRFANGELGTVLKKLMSDRRVDLSAKYSPCFGKYAFLADGSQDDLHIAIDNQVAVTGRSDERPVLDWLSSARGVKPQFYQNTWLHRPENGGLD